MGRDYTSPDPTSPRHDSDPETMFLTSLLLSLAPTTAPLPLPQDDRRAKVSEQYKALAEARDAESLGELWKQNRGLVLQTIDADLEGSLALWEKDKEKAPKDQIAALHARALYGAEVASQALQQPIFLDYASSFVGWNDQQKASFRAGQQVYGRAMRELKEKNWEVALEAGRETVERASALGDWWGMAMGYGAEAEAARQLGWFEDSLRAFSMARQINHDLGLEYSEYKNLEGLVAVARADSRFTRALVAAKDWVASAKAFKDQAGLKKALTSLVAIQKELGQEEDAKASQTELDKLE